jgi:hypothetical protein
MVNDCCLRSIRSARIICHSRFEIHSAVGSTQLCCLIILAAKGVAAAGASVAAKVKASESALVELAVTQTKRTLCQPASLQHIHR